MDGAVRCGWKVRLLVSKRGTVYFEREMKRKGNFFVGALIGALLGGGTLEAADWPQFLGPNRDGVSAEADWNSDWSVREPLMEWRTPVGVGSASFAIVGGKLYTTGNNRDQDVVSCLDAATGKTLWQHSTPLKFDERMFDGGTAATPTVDGNRVYALSHKGHLFCLDRNLGDVIWSKHLVNDLGGKEPRWGYAGSPLVHGNLLITEPGGKGSSVVALDKLSGKIVWRSGDDEASYASPISYRTKSGDRVAVMNAYGLVGLDLDDGDQLFRVRWKTSYDVNATTPLFFADKAAFFITSNYRKGAGLVGIQGDRAGSLLYKSKSLRLKFQSAVRYGDRVFGVIDELKCIDIGRGKEVWDHTVSGSEGNVIVAGGRLIVLSEKGELIVGNPGETKFEETGRMQVLKGRCWVLPAIANGRIYCRNNAGEVVCIDVRG